MYSYVCFGFIPSLEFLEAKMVLPNSSECNTHITLSDGNEILAPKLCKKEEFNKITIMKKTLIVFVLTDVGSQPFGSFTARYTIQQLSKYLFWVI